MPKEATAVLFSGGSDSTLAAAMAAKNTSRIYLVTYEHSFMFRHHKIDVNVSSLQKVFPQTEFIHHKEDINRLFKKLYFDRLVPYIRQYGTMILPWICGACKLAMHINTINFCNRRNIKNVCCGAHQESARIFPAQMPGIIDLIRELYMTNGIKYKTPVYEKDRPDRILFEKGIISNPNMKKQHLIYSTQYTCPLGIILHAHSRLFYRPLLGLSRYQRKIQELFEAKLIDMNQILTGMVENEYPRDKQS
jgi:7-cyano-7-deazaguanine synthase in queuosine biosynthesis